MLLEIILRYEQNVIEVSLNCYKGNMTDVVSYVIELMR